MAASSSKFIEKKQTLLMPLQPEAFARPVDIKEILAERTAFLMDLYKKQPPTYVFNEDFKIQIEYLCAYLYRLAQEYKIIDENLAEIAAFPAYFFELIATNPKIVPSEKIKQSLEKMIYLLQKKTIITKEAICNRFTGDKKLNEEEITIQFELETKNEALLEMRKVMVLEQTLPHLRTCSTGILGYLDFACQLLSGGHTLQDVWCDLRTKIVTNFGFFHINKHKNSLLPQNEIHVPIVLRAYALKKQWGIRSDMEHVSDHFARTTQITADTLEEFEMYFKYHYQLRSMINSFAQHFEMLFFKKYRLPFIGKAENEKHLRNSWVPFQSEIMYQAEDILKEMNMDTKAISAKKMFDAKEEGAFLRFSLRRVKQVFLQYCQRQKLYVDEACWGETAIFSEYKLMHSISPRYRDLSWIEDKAEGNIISFEELSTEEQLDYFIYSAIHFDETDYFGLQESPGSFYKIFHEKPALFKLAKALENLSNLERSTTILQKIFKERPQYFATLLEAVNHDTRSRFLDLIGFDFYWLHPKHELHEHAKQVLMCFDDVDIATWIATERLQKIGGKHLEKFQAEHKLNPETLPIPYSELLRLSITPVDNIENQYIFKLYLQQYFPVAFRKTYLEEKPNYIKAFKTADENEIFPWEHAYIKYWVLDAKDGKWSTLKDAKDYEIVMLGKFINYSQQPELLTSIFQKFVKGSSQFCLQVFLANVFSQRKAFQELLLSDINLNTIILTKDSFGAFYFTALNMAAYSGNIEDVRLLLKRGARVNLNLKGAPFYQKNQLGTPLYMAAFRGHIGMVRLFLDENALIEEKMHGKTALYIAARQGHRDIVQLLFEHGASIDATADDNSTPLIMAAEQGHIDVVRFLLEKGAAIDAITRLGATAFLVAAKRGHLEIVHLLVKSGASISLKSGAWAEPLNYVTHPQIKQLILIEYMKLELKKMQTSKRSSSWIIRVLETDPLISGSKKLLEFVEGSGSLEKITPAENALLQKTTLWQHFYVHALTIARADVYVPSVKNI